MKRVAVIEDPEPCIVTGEIVLRLVAAPVSHSGVMPVAKGVSLGMEREKRSGPRSRVQSNGHKLLRRLASGAFG